MRVLPDLLALAKYSNIAVKATGAPSYSQQDYAYRDIHDHIHSIFDALVQTVLFGGRYYSYALLMERVC